MDKITKVSVLGTEYTIEQKPEDERMFIGDGFCDRTTKRIVLDRMDKGSLDDPKEYRKQVLRHELTHAFFFESGLTDCYKPSNDETLIDWIAYQFPKMIEAFQKADAL